MIMIQANQLSAFKYHVLINKTTLSTFIKTARKTENISLFICIELALKLLVMINCFIIVKLLFQKPWPLFVQTLLQ